MKIIKNGLTGIGLFVITTILLVLLYLHFLFLPKLHAHHKNIPYLSDQEVALLEKVQRDLICYAHDPNSMYIETITQTAIDGDIRVNIGYYDTNYDLSYHSGKLEFSYAICDRFSPLEYIFDKNGNLKEPAYLLEKTKK